MHPKLLPVFLLLVHQVLCDGDQPKIIIVGAGPSGIAAASKLIKNGLTNIKILEAQDRIGGRIHSVKFGNGLVDLGAEFCHGQEGNPVWPMVKDLDLVKSSNFKMHYMGSDGQKVDKAFAAALEGLLELYHDGDVESEIQKECPGEVKLGVCMRQLYKQRVEDKFKDDPATAKLIKPGLKWLEGAVDSYESSFNWDDVRISSDYADLSGDLSLTWHGKGYKTFLDILMEKYPDKKGLPVEEKIEFNKEVEKVTLGDKKITVKTKDGATYDAEHVIMTPSVGVLKERHAAMFEPKLPDEKIKAIEGIGFDAVVKVFLHFPQKIWDQPNNIIYIAHYLWTEDDEAKVKEEFPQGLTKDGKVWLTNLIASVTSRTDGNILTSWYAGEHIPEIEKLPKDVVVKGTMYVVKKFSARNLNFVDPDDAIVTNWWSNPLFRGSWSHESIKDPHGEGKLPNKLAAPISNSDCSCMLQFAGEATSLGLYGTVGGAMEAGHREADRIIKEHKK